jgi:arsenate reductase
MKLLFICTHNRCRSILSEAITNHMNTTTNTGNISTRFVAKSAGSQPSGQIHPDTIAHLHKHGIETHDLASQSWDEFEDYHADIVITVCDTAANESCPLWMHSSQNNHQAILAHWPLTDPSKILDKEASRLAFEHCISEIKQRTALMLNSQIDTSRRDEQIRQLQSWGLTIRP